MRILITATFAAPLALSAQYSRQLCLRSPLITGMAHFAFPARCSGPLAQLDCHMVERRPGLISLAALGPLGNASIPSEVSTASAALLPIPQAPLRSGLLANPGMGR